MALRDTQSYESQIIDAVRSVNKALGGTYGTSSAIYKNEFNQYEVQLIDAIRGISRTLSGKGLVIGSGEGEEVDLTGIYEQLTSLSRRVKTLEDESFFRLVDGNITLKEGYSNLWVPGFLAAGGIGSSSSGGVTKLRELDDVYHSSTSVLRANGNDVQAGDVLMYDSTHGWVASASGGGYVLPVASAQTLGGIKVGTGLSISNDGTLSVTGGGGGSTVSVTQVVSSGTKIATITVDSVPTDIYAPVTSGYVLGTAVASTAARGTMLGVSALSYDLSSTGSEQSLIKWEPNAGGTGIGAWHVYGNLYADGWVAAGGIGSGSAVSSVTVTQILSSGTKIATITVDGVATDLYAPSGGGGGGISTVQLKTGSTNGTLKLSVDGVDGSDVAVYGLGSLAYKSSLLASDIPDLSSTYVTLSTTQTITGAKTFTTNPVTIGSTSGISVDASSYIDIGDARLVYESGALHVTHKSGVSTTIGLYCDGWIAAGGAQSS